MVCAGIFAILAIGVVFLGVWIERNTSHSFPTELLSVDARGRSPRFYAYDFSDRAARVGARREVTAEVYAGRRTEIVKEGDLPPHVKAAFIAIEDKRFYTHRGVDWRRTLAATANDLFGFSDSFGGSTVTQQLVKNLTGHREIRWQRKLQEILWARDLERRMEKDEILTFYLNIISFADRCEGIGTAAAHYFGKKVRELTVAESACLAAIINNPT